MQAVIVSSRIVHRVQFAPSPSNPSFPTSPEIVETRRVRDIEEFPDGVNYVSFNDVVETEVRVGGMTRKVCSEPFNETTVLVRRDDGSHWVNRSSYYEIKMHPNLKGKLWVFGSTSQSESRDQKND